MSDERLKQTHAEAVAVPKVEVLDAARPPAEPGLSSCEGCHGFEIMVD
jgi:hypothetical protein